MGGLVIVLVAGLVLLPHSEGFGLRPLAVVSIAVSVVCLVLVARSASGGVWSMPFVGLVVLIVFHLGALPQFLGRRTATQAYIERFIHLPETAMAAWISLLAVVSFTTGSCLVADRRGTRATRSEPETRRRGSGFSMIQALSYAGTLMGLGGIVAWMSFAHREGLGVGSSYADYLAVKTTASVQLFYYLIGLGLVLAALDHRRWPARLLCLAFVGFAAIGFPLGLRGEVLFPAAAALTVIAVQRRMPRPRTTGVVALVTLVLITVVSQTRQREGFDLSHVSFSPMDGVSQLGQSLNVVSAIAHWHHDLGEHYQWGGTYWAPVHDAFVRYVLLGTPLPESANPAQLETQIASRVGDVGGSIVGEAFHNFGMVGVLLVLGLWGIALGWLNEQARRHPGWLPVAGVAAFVFILEVRNPFDQVPTVLVLAAVAVLAASALVAVSNLLAKVLERRDTAVVPGSVLFGSIGVRTLVLVVAFTTSLLMARGLGPDGRGLVSLLMTLGVLAASLGGLSAELGFAHHFGRTGDRRTQILSGAMYGSIGWGVVVGAVTALVAGLVWSPPGDVTQALLFLGSYTFLTLSSTWTQRALFLEGEPVRAALISLISSTLTLAVVAGLTVTGGLTVRWALAAVVGGALLGTVLSLAWTCGRPRFFRLRDVTSALATGTRFHLGQVALQLLVRFDIVLLSAMAGLTSVGVYSVAVSLTAPVGVFATTIGTTYLRDQFAIEDDHARVATLRLMAVTTLLVVPVMALIVLLAVPLVPLIWGSAFSGARWPLILLSPGVIAMAAQRAVGNYFVRIGSAWVLNVRAVAAVLVNVALCLVLIPAWGANGAAVASTGAYAVYAAISVQFWARHARIRIAELGDAFRYVGLATTRTLRGRAA